MSELSFSIFEEYSNLLIAFSEKKDGSMKLNKGAVENKSNRNKFLKKLGIQPDQLAFAELVHGSEVKTIKRQQAGSIIHQTDALLTREENLFLGTTFADCLPIFIYEPVKEVVGLVHGGWRGLAKNIIESTLKKMRKDFEIKSEKLKIGIGPGVCKEHYEVGREVIEEFNSFPKVFEEKEGSYYLSLKGVAKLQFIEQGVKEKNIEISSKCTYKSKKYFSYRQSESDSTKTMMGVIGKYK